MHLLAILRVNALESSAQFCSLVAHLLLEKRPMTHFQKGNHLLRAILQPCRSYPIWKSTNDPFSNWKSLATREFAAFSLILHLKINQWPIFKLETTCYPRFCGLFAHLLFENRPMIDFQIGNHLQPAILRPFCSFPIWKSTIDPFSNVTWRFKTH